MHHAMSNGTRYLGPHESAVNGIMIGSVVFVGLTGVRITLTETLTDHGTCDMCSNRPRLCDARDAA